VVNNKVLENSTKSKSKNRSKSKSSIKSSNKRIKLKAIAKIVS